MAAKSFVWCGERGDVALLLGECGGSNRGTRKDEESGDDEGEGAAAGGGTVRFAAANAGGNKWLTSREAA
eukprot:CAMPEP_0176417618 /NCGR_PEP_ID=MMETSP0127-20121128/6992_1 /TAXON_ID=938130 /ORGANISM="Platyophrya macrostoma, Strain WH" /LENGTH=69 /DNA_ID=CAMNT_0017797805 /DNA_START=134 /DNA_END=343 /DNA_ORIENTATION=-